MPSLGPAGGGVARISQNSPAVVETQSSHGLADGDRVRIEAVEPNDAPKLFYVKCSDHADNEFAAYSDVQFKTPAEVNSVAQGACVVRLAAEDWAVIAGINYYPAYSQLNGPVRDATRFDRWLKSNAWVPDDQISLSVSPVPPPGSVADARPTLDEVKKGFENLARMAYTKDLHRVGRRLYIFLSGHGILPTRSEIPSFNEAALLMANSDTATLGNHLGGNAYAEWFRAAGVFDEVILFMDCCRDQKDNVALTPPSMPAIKAQRDAAKRFYAAATQLDSKSWERPFGTPPEVRGVFSHVLMEALESPSLCDSGGSLTGQILAGQLYKEVPKLQNGQNPDIDYKPEFDIVFLKRFNQKRPQARITFAAQFYGKTIELVGKNYPNSDATHVIDAQPWLVGLDPFNYKLEIKDTRQQKFFEVDGKHEVLDVTFP